MKGQAACADLLFIIEWESGFYDCKSHFNRTNCKIIYYPYDRFHHGQDRSAEGFRQ